MDTLKREDGTYNHCSMCKIKRNCCCDFHEGYNGIDNIVITVAEKDKIIKKLGDDANKHFKEINKEAYNIISQNAICPFFNNGCLIYDIRPSDCRLFPYDLKEISGKYYLIQYDLPCGSKQVNENVDEVVEVLITIIKTYTDKNVNERVNKLKYKIIKEVKI